MKQLLLQTLFLTCTATISFAQTVNYDIPIGDMLGVTQTSGDICSSPWTTEEAKQSSIGNSWGGTWMSTNSGVATSVVVQVAFTISDSTVSTFPTTLNGSANNNINSGPPVDCGMGTLLSWNIDPSNYNSMGTNTFMVDYATSGIINQLDNLPFMGDPYMRVIVSYQSGTSSLSELEQKTAELVKITDLMGRETEFKANTPLLYVYSDGSVYRICEVK